MSAKEILDILSNLANTPRIDELKAYIYDLQKENLDLKSKVHELESKLNVLSDWKEKASHYAKFITQSGSIVYIKSKESPVIHYCPSCFDKKINYPTSKSTF